MLAVAAHVGRDSNRAAEERDFIYNWVALCLTFLCPPGTRADRNLNDLSDEHLQPNLCIAGVCCVNAFTGADVMR